MRPLKILHRCTRNTAHYSSYRRNYSHLPDLVALKSSKYQIYLSKSDDPIFNLSFEHFLLQSTHVESTVLFLYINKPCIVIGRNQNPWLETNLGGLPSFHGLGLHNDGAGLSKDGIEVVRRRSGGGTVFHDHGNVNFSIICPPHAFTRDKHAEMVVRAIRPHSPRARVNERHDIVLDTGDHLPPGQRPDQDKTHRLPYEPGTPLKVSGSAYKLTRTRALHHGTCLVNSRNVGRISSLLRSPLAPFVKARGVESVRSAVGNVFSLEDAEADQIFKRIVIQQFCHEYGIRAPISERLLDPSHTDQLWTFESGVYGVLGGELGESERIKSSMQEMRSAEWLYGQTPQFTFSTFSTPEDPRPRPPLPPQIPTATRIHLSARNGRITSAEASLSPSMVFASSLIEGQDIHRLVSWNEVLRLKHGLKLVDEQLSRDIRALGDWLDYMFAIRAGSSKRSVENV